MKCFQPTRMPRLPKEVQEKLPTPLPGAVKHIDIADIVSLRKKGLSHSAIGKVLGCAEKNISKRLRRVRKDLEGVEDFKKQRADLLAIQQQKILGTFDTTVIKKAGLKDRTIAFGVLYDKERLERGKGLEEQGLKIEIINFAGASNTGQGVATRVTFVPREDPEVVDADVADPA